MYIKYRHGNLSKAALLGTKRTDSLEHLIEYVGAEGRYIAVTKSVRISYPLDYLKGIEIVDTPGFNDPVVSREERTKEFLGKADAVVMLLYAGRAFDATDKDIIFNKIRRIGVGKIVIGINKYDLNYAQGETEREMIDNVKEQLYKASYQYQDNAISELATEREPLLLSAHMAMMSQMGLEVIRKDNTLNFYYQQALENFEISTQNEMYEKSLLRPFENTIKDIALKAKGEILIRKPLNSIKQVGENKLDEISIETAKLESLLKILDKPDLELEELLDNAKKAQRKLDKKIEGLEIDIIEQLLRSIKKLERETWDMVSFARRKCNELIDDRLVVINRRALIDQITYEIDGLERKLDREFSRSNDEINNSIKKNIRDFVEDIDEVCHKYLEDFDVKDYLGIFKKHFISDIVNIKYNDLIIIDNQESGDLSLFEKAMSFLGGFVNGATFGLAGVIENVVAGRQTTRSMVDQYFSLLNLNPINKNISDNGQSHIQMVKGSITTDFLEPIILKVEELVDNKANREREIETYSDDLKSLRKDKIDLDSQIDQLRALKQLI